MKLLVVLVVCIVAGAASEERINGENGWFVPKLDGTFEWMDKDVAEAEIEQLSLIGDLLSPVTFYLYTKSNPATPQEITAENDSIAASYFNPNNPTRFIIHGWSSSFESENVLHIREAWFTHGDANMISVDWGRARSIDYVSSVVAVRGVGEKVADLINFLRDNFGVSLDTTMIIGHSLGAHVSGYAGKNIKNGQVHMIIGCDPAWPLFSYDTPSSRLSSDDAAYVQSIQTSGALLGFQKPIGKGAFYPNGGKSQSGCGLDLVGSCAHSRSMEYYAEAVEYNNFATIECSDYEQAVAKECGDKLSTVLMGAMTNADMVSGVYYVPINSESPYGQAA